MIQHYIKLCRPGNWLKNVFVFIPLVFALKLTDALLLRDTGIAFVAFCCVSSAVYIFNDIKDADSDRRHPVKCTRPVASGKIRKKDAAVLGVALLVLGTGASCYVNFYTAVYIVVYLVENILYTMVLKDKPVFDVFCIAAGFVLRIFAGGAATGEGVSDWLFLTVLAMSLFMAFGKRRGEMLKVGRENRRPVLEGYDIDFLNGMMFATAGLGIMFYSLWAMNRGKGMLCTTPFILFIVCRYLLLVHSTDSHGDPTTVILSDKTLVIACMIYALVVVVLLYLG